MSRMFDGTAVCRMNQDESDPRQARQRWRHGARVPLCEVPVDPLTMHQAVQAVEECLDADQSLSIGVVNVAKIVNMQKDPLLRESVLSSDLILADGAPLVWLSRLKKTPLPERVAGIDLMFNLFSLADQRRFRVFLLGAQKATLQTVVEAAGRQFPGMVVAGYRDGFFNADQEREIAESIRDAAPHMLFVAMTSPKKEIFMKKWGPLMNVSVTHGVGGSFDVMAGLTRRAPKWMQAAGLEWFYRVLQEPRRMWKRYLVTNSAFLFLATRDLLQRSRFSQKD